MRLMASLPITRTAVTHLILGELIPQDDAAITIEFGREILIDRLRLLFRADIPHDNYWQQVSVRFSDGEVKTFKTTNSYEFQFAQKKTKSIELFNLIKADDHAEWPALQQIEAYGYNLL